MLWSVSMKEYNKILGGKYFQNISSVLLTSSLTRLLCCSFQYSIMEFYFLHMFIIFEYGIFKFVLW